ncbi:MAG: hypothetical protein P4L49_00265 [Desulfosporosinus sp.]|nr:hypothetical protein [Desulfosporosinus sp.]
MAESKARSDGYTDRWLTFSLLLGLMFIHITNPGKQLRPSAESLRRLVERAGRLYEQRDVQRLWLYVARWTQWLWGGLKGMVRLNGRTKRYFVYVLKSLKISDIQIKQYSKQQVVL